MHRRRLVINIGEKKFGSQILGGKNFGQIYFQTKNLEKISLLFSSKFLTTFYFFFFSHRQLFYKMYTFHSKCTPFSCCCLCFCFPSCLFFLNKQILKILV